MVYINKLKQLSNDRANQQFYHLMLDNDGVLWLSSADEGVYCMNFPKKSIQSAFVVSAISRSGNYAIRGKSPFQSKVAISGWAPVGRVFIGWTGTV